MSEPRWERIGRTVNVAPQHTVLPGLRACRTCGYVYPETRDYFFLNPSTKEGLKYICHACDDEAQVSYKEITALRKELSDALSRITGKIVRARERLLLVGKRRPPQTKPEYEAFVEQSRLTENQE